MINFQGNSDPKIDIEQLKSLSELGIDVDFLADIEDDIVASQQDYGLKHSLHQNLLALKKLDNEQRERLFSFCIITILF